MENNMGQALPEYISENLLTLRRRLKLSQKEMIQRYLSQQDGVPMVSVATLSNVENGSSRGGLRIAEHIAQQMKVDISVFTVEPDTFAKNIDLFFGSALEEPQRDGSAPSRITSNVDALVQQISDYLMEAIIHGDLRPGSKLPSDRDLSVMFGMGRTSVREAMKVLSTLGLVDILPGKGTFIASKSTNFFLLPLTWSFLIGENNTDHIIDVRNVLEVEAAKTAAEKATAESLAALEDIYRRMRLAFEASDFATFLSLDLDFHLAIATCSGNPIICNLLFTSRKLLSYISKSGMVTVQHLQDIFKEHGQIYEAITERNTARAGAAMSAHLATARTRYQLKKPI